VYRLICRGTNRQTHSFVKLFFIVMMVLMMIILIIIVVIVQTLPYSPRSMALLQPDHISQSEVDGSGLPNNCVLKETNN